MLPYIVLTKDHVGANLIEAFGRQWLVHNFIGQILPRDIGKRVYRMGDMTGGHFLQVENDEQRDRRTRQWRI